MMNTRDEELPFRKLRQNGDKLFSDFVKEQSTAGLNGMYEIEKDALIKVLELVIQKEVISRQDILSLASRLISSRVSVILSILLGDTNKLIEAGAATEKDMEEIRASTRRFIAEELLTQVELLRSSRYDEIMTKTKQSFPEIFDGLEEKVREAKGETK